MKSSHEIGMPCTSMDTMSEDNLKEGKFDASVLGQRRRTEQTGVTLPSCVDGIKVWSWSGGEDGSK